MDGMFLFYLILSGFGAGAVTGLAGASAATIVTPIMTIFGGVPAYTAITMALFTDVFASSMSAFTFWKNGNIDIKKGSYFTIFVVIGSIIGSWASTKVDSDALSVISVVMIMVISINFLKKSNRLKKEYEGLVEKQEPKLFFQDNKQVAIIVSGVIVGFLCGFVGAGGGLLILVILSSIMGMDTKMGVGTSVFVMTFTALSGGLAHIPNVEPLANGMSLVTATLITSAAGVVGAQLAAKFANKTKEYVLLRIVALTFIILVGSSAVRAFLIK